MDFKNVDEGHPDGEEPLHFYYNREERLKTAPKIVQDYYNGKVFNNTGGVKGLFKSLVGTRTNRFMFIGIILFAAAIYLFSFFSDFNNKTACGLSVELSAFRYGDSIYASLKINEKKDEKSESSGDEKKSDSKADGASVEKSENSSPENNVAAVFKAYDNSGNVAYVSEKQVQQYDGKELFLRATFTDYDIIKVEAFVTYDGKSDSVSAKVEKR